MAGVQGGALLPEQSLMESKASMDSSWCGGSSSSPAPLPSLCMLATATNGRSLGLHVTVSGGFSGSEARCIISREQEKFFSFFFNSQDRVEQYIFFLRDGCFLRLFFENTI